MSMTVNGNLYHHYAVQNAKEDTKKKEAYYGYHQAEETKMLDNEAKQPRLSNKAAALLEKLRKTYGEDMDFMVADFSSTEEAKAALAHGTKEFSVLFSVEELEKMASDENIEQEYMERIQKALNMSDEINGKYGFESGFGKNNNGVSVTNLAVAFHADGTMTLFADLEKSSALQRERMEKAEKEKTQQTEKTEKEKFQEYISQKADNPWMYSDVKRTSVQADSVEELLEKIQAVNWDAVYAGYAGGEPEHSKLNFSI